MRRIAIILIVLFGMGAAGAQDAQDVKGGADHPLIPRYEGSVIKRYQVERYTDYRLVVDKLKREKDPAAMRELEGKLTRITYRAPAERAVLEVFRNYEKALADAGFKTIYGCARTDCGANNHMKYTIEAGLGIPHGPMGDGSSHRYLAAHLTRVEGDVYLSLYVTKSGAGGGPDKGRTMIQLDVMELEPMEDRMVVVEASKMQRDLDAEGRVAIYGIHFDFDKDTLRPDSKPQLDEIGKLLSSNPSLKVMVVGHTDSQGAAGYNLDLSQRRANRVVEALAGDYGIDKARMTPMGAGMSAPVASNATEEGRVQNRRVELVRQ